MLQSPLIHRVRVHLTPGQREQLQSWRSRLATLQMCAELLHAAVLDGRRPDLLHDPVRLLAAARSGDWCALEPNRSVIGHFELRLPNVYT